jgi:hypothetical protein
MARSELTAEYQSDRSGCPVDLWTCQTVSFKHLVFGKAVQFRHYPVTVNAERSALCSKPLGIKSWEGCPISTKRKSGDRPDANLGLSTSMGELNSMNTRFTLRIAWQLPQDHFPLCL